MTIQQRVAVAFSQAAGNRQAQRGDEQRVLDGEHARGQGCRGLAPRDANPRLRPVLVGDGPDADEVRRLIRELDLERDVRWVPDGLGREMIPAFDVFLMTSRYEGFPYVLLEALNAGCAIVTTDVGGAPDCVRQGRNGFIAPADEAALAATILDIAADTDRFLAMRRGSRALASEFSIDRMIGRVADLYRSIHADDTSSQR